MSSHTLEPDRVGAVLDGRYDQPRALYELQATGYHFSRDHSYYLTSSKVFLLPIILQVVRMITTWGKDGFVTSQTRDFLNSLKDWARCDVDFKRGALKRLILLFALWVGCQYVAAVDLLDENEVSF